MGQFLGGKVPPEVADGDCARVAVDAESPVVHRDGHRIQGFDGGVGICARCITGRHPVSVETAVPEGGQGDLVAPQVGLHACLGQAVPLPAEAGVVFHAPGLDVVGQEGLVGGIGGGGEDVVVAVGGDGEEH